MPGAGAPVFKGDGRRHSDWFNSRSTQNTPMINEDTKYAPCALLCSQMMQRLTHKRH